MTGWPIVHWSQARQITQVMGVKGPLAPSAGVTPDQHFRDLLAHDRQSDAVRFLAHALPRYEMIAWTTQVVTAIRPDSEREPEALRALEVARRWVRDPSDDIRRQAWTMAEAMDDNTPEKLLLVAIFLSGGSMAPEDLPPVHPPEESAASLGGAAIALACYNTPSPVSALAGALEMGESVAKRAG